MGQRWCPTVGAPGSSEVLHIFLRSNANFKITFQFCGTCRHVFVSEKICLSVSKSFHVCAHNSFAYYQLHRNKSIRFTSPNHYFFKRRNKSNCGGSFQITVYMILEYNSMRLFVFNKCVAHKIVYLYCLKIMRMLNNIGPENFEILLLQRP